MTGLGNGTIEMSGRQLISRFEHNENLSFYDANLWTIERTDLELIWPKSLNFQEEEANNSSWTSDAILYLVVGSQDTSTVIDTNVLTEQWRINQSATVIVNLGDNFLKWWNLSRDQRSDQLQLKVVCQGKECGARFRNVRAQIRLNLVENQLLQRGKRSRLRPHQPKDIFKVRER